jgi:hypothetical protein
MDGVAALVFEGAKRFDVRIALARYHIVAEALELIVVAQFLQTVDKKIGRHPWVILELEALSEVR